MIISLLTTNTYLLIFNDTIIYLIDEYFLNIININHNYISHTEDNYKYNKKYKWFYYYLWTSVQENIKILFSIFNDLVNIENKKELSIIINKNSWENQNIGIYEGIKYSYDNNWNVIWKSLKLPKNLFVIWTINLDETTKSISPKVVDRANLIEFNDLDNFLFIEDNNKYDLDLFSLLDTNINFEDILKIREYVWNFNWDIKDFDKKYQINEEIENSLNLIYQFLKIFKLHFSYRTLKEIIIFINIWKKLLDWKGIKNLENKLYDVAILQKILPKLNWIIDYNFKLYWKKDNKDMHLFYDINNIDSNSALLDFKKSIEWWFYNHEDNFKNSSMKLKRMQQFFDNYQNVNYFLS